jgi:hypothetical protein
LKLIEKHLMVLHLLKKMVNSSVCQATTRIHEHFDSIRSSLILLLPVFTYVVVFHTTIFFSNLRHKETNIWLGGHFRFQSPSKANLETKLNRNYK